MAESVLLMTMVTSNWSELKKMIGNALQFVLPPDPGHRDVVEPAAAAAPHAQVLPEQLVHPFLIVPFAGRFPDAYEPAVALL